MIRSLATGYQVIVVIAPKPTLLVASALASIMLAACSGPIETRAGLQGTTMPVGATVMVVASRDQTGPLAEAARQVVSEELARHGYTIAETGPVRLVVSLAERPASLEVLAASGPPLSKAKRPKLLQNCADRIQRLTLAAEMQGGGISRAWAEEDHCNGSFEQSLHPLAAQAIAKLIGSKTAPQRALRFGTD